MRSPSKDTILKLALLCMGMLAVVTAHTLIGRLWQPKSVMAPMKVGLHVSMPDTMQSTWTSLLHNWRTSSQFTLASEVAFPATSYAIVLSVQLLMFLAQFSTRARCAVQEISLQSRLQPQNNESSWSTTCAAVLHDPVTKTNSYKVRHVYVETSDKLYRSPGAAYVRNLFPKSYVSKPHL